MTYDVEIGSDANGQRVKITAGGRAVMITGPEAGQLLVDLVQSGDRAHAFDRIISEKFLEAISREAP